MANDQLLSWVVTVVGLTGFHLAGKKVWWAWYINLACQALWFAYAYVTSTPAFAVSALFFTFVFGNNAIKWTKEEISKKKEASGNLSKNRNNRRTPVPRWFGRWHEPRPVGKQQRKRHTGSTS